MLHKATIRLDSASRGAVTLDGTEIKGILAVGLEAAGGSAPILTLRLEVGGVDADIEAIPLDDDRGEMLTHDDVMRNRS